MRNRVSAPLSRIRRTSSRLKSLGKLKSMTATSGASFSKVSRAMTPSEH